MPVAEVLQRYHNLLDSLWHQASLILGETAVSTLFETALFNAESDYSCLQGVQITGAGLDLSALAESQVEASLLHQALEHWVREFFGVLRLLTGDLVVRQLRPLWEAAQREMEGAFPHE